MFEWDFAALKEHSKDGKDGKEGKDDSCQLDTSWDYFDQVLS